MRRRLLALVALIALTSGRTAAAAPPISSTEARSLLNRYCVSCHNERAKTAGLMLDALDVGRVAERAEVWEAVVRKLRAGAMPPAGLPRPDQAAHDGLVAWLESTLDRAAEARPNPGRPVLHRLNRAEYANAIRDLLALDVDTASLLPPDDSSSGFDNNADVLGVSPSLLERYLSAAADISALALGNRNVAPRSETYNVRGDVTQTGHIEGLPIGTRGGMLVRHTFPLDGEYIIKTRLLDTASGTIRGLQYPHQVEVLLEGERLRLASMGGDADFEQAVANSTASATAVNGRLTVRVSVKAGPRTVAATFLQRTAAAGAERLQRFQRSTISTSDHTGLPHIASITIEGPFNVSGPGDTPSRRRILTCQPKNQAAEAPCAATIIGTLARRAYRRPVATAELKRLTAFFEDGRRDRDFEAGIERALRAILASAPFLFRIEHEPAVAPGTPYRLSDLEIASRLSFFLWSSIPDDELLEVASRGQLRNPAVLDRQVRRMLADPRAQALVVNFAGQWLQLRNLRASSPDQNEFPDFDDNLRQAFRRETELLFDSIIREDRNVLDLMTADYTFVNERLARHYGMPSVYGSQFRRVPVTDETRKGLLGKGAIHLVTSQPNRTSPVVRGKWILENLLGTPPPRPPANVPPLDEAASGKPRTLREQMEAHRANPVCASCHKIMDPLGFAMENFDAVGAWRTRDAGAPIDASGQLTDGTPVDGVVTLRQGLLKRPEVFVGTITEKLLTYALGRGLAYFDEPAVRRIVRQAAPHNYRFSSLVLGIVNSTPFTNRLKAEGSELPKELVSSKP